MLSSFMENYRLAGYDVQVNGPLYVPLDVEMSVCVLPDYLQAHVEQALYEAFSNTILSNGQVGFFYPDNFTFAQTIVSQSDHCRRDGGGRCVVGQSDDVQNAGKTPPVNWRQGKSKWARCKLPDSITIPISRKTENSPFT